MLKAQKALMKNLPVLMEKAGMSQTDLAHATGQHAPQINRYLRGKGGPPKLDKLEALAEALGVSIAALIGDDVPEPVKRENPVAEQRLEIARFALTDREDNDVRIVWDTLAHIFKDRAARKNKGGTQRA